MSSANCTQLFLEMWMFQLYTRATPYNLLIFRSEVKFPPPSHIAHSSRGSPPPAAPQTATPLVGVRLPLSPGGKAALQGKAEVMMPAWWFLHCPVRLWWLLCCHYEVLLLYYKQSMNVCPSFQADSSFVSKVSLKFPCTIWYSWSCFKLEVGPGDSRDPFQSKLITDFMQHMDMIDTKSCLCLILCHICKSVWKGCISPKLVIYLFL